MRTKLNKILHHEKPEVLLHQTVTVAGWVRSIRDQKSFAFLALNDGSTFANLQVVIDSDLPHYETIIPSITTGASVQIIGEIVESPGKNQSIEIKASEVTLIGACDPETYPLQKKRHSFEFLRTIAHLRTRTNTQGAVARVRNALAFATHKYFQEEGFLYVQTPIISGSDCEGSGEMFKVTTLDSKETDYTKDFFQKPAYLTVSGQLEAEIYALAFSDVYTFGPTFRAENSHTSRHLAEFWMIEPEMAFADLAKDIECAEKYIKYVVRYAMDSCPEDLNFFDKFVEKGLLEKLKNLVDSPFEKLPYSDAIEILTKASKKFTYPVKWGLDLQSEHERYLTETHFKKPVVLTDYPKEIKAFYMRDNDDGKTVAAMDILVPGIGELVGGSQREERLDVLEKKLEKHNLNPEDYWWYLELRKYGSVPHSGFGVGFERLVQFVTGMENIRDVIAFPRYPGHVEF
jgi:asparaginyl-tRNA synthetase